MNENELKELEKALKQIDRCLDERFEENADLYIAPEQVEDIKKLIYAGNYDRLVKECSPALKKYSSQVMAHVIIKNAWLMRSPKYETLKPIFEQCSYNDLNAVMEESVLDNKIAMPANFRFFLIETYLSKVPAEICRQMLDRNLTFLNNVTLRAWCLRQSLKDETKITERYKIFRRAVDKSSAILTQTKILAEMFPSAEFNDDFIESVFDDSFVHETPCTTFWIDVLGAESVSYIMSNFKSYCRMNSSNRRRCCDVLKRVFLIGKKNLQVFATAFADSCNCMDGSENKKALVEQCLTRTSTNEETILKNALKNNGLDFSNIEHGKLATLEEIKETLDEDYITGGKYNWLVLSFDKQYRIRYEQALDEIGNDIFEYEHFEEFCCRLFERTDRYYPQNLKYMLYVIDNLVEDDADEDDDIVKRLLNHIENKNIFETYKNLNGIEKIKTFVREKDFNLYCRLLGN